MDKDHAKKFVSLLQNIVDINEKRIATMKKIHSLQDFIMTPNVLAEIHHIDDVMEEESSEDVSEQHGILSLVDITSKINLPLLRRKYSKWPKSTNNFNIIIPFNSFNIKRQYGNNEDDVKGNRNNYFIRMGYTNKDNPEKNNRNNDKKSQKVYNRNYLNTKIYERNHYNGKDNKNEDFYDKISNRNDNSDVKDYRSDYNDNIDGTNHRKNWRGSCSRNAAKACKKACVTAHTNVCMRYKCSRRAKMAFRKECKRSCKATFITGQYSDSDMEQE